jgi:hypothetical protein
MMSEHQRETAFLWHCLRYEDSAEHQALDERITQIQRDERCVRRAVWLMALLTALVVAGLCYAAVLVDNFPYNTPQLIVNIICALGLASMICMVVFVGLRMVYRMKLDQRREECRQLVTKFLESRLGKRVTTPWREIRVGDGNRETIQVAGGRNGSPDKTELTARA